MHMEQGTAGPSGPEPAAAGVPAGTTPAGPTPAEVSPARQAALREPAHRVSPRAVGYWRLRAAIEGTVETAVVFAGWWFLPSVFDSRPWWATVLLVLVTAAAGVQVVVMPVVRFRVHRWEVTPIAVFTRSGWLTREERIAPLSRVQTVDSTQGALMRAFGLASITVTTASAAGPISIDCLDEGVARRTVAELTEVTGSVRGDAT